MMEILRILNSEDKILGAKHISEELQKRGYFLGERAVRYHMRILDEKGFTEKVGHKGRVITQKGIDEIKEGLIYDQVNFSYSRFQEKMYKVKLDLATATGSVIVNVSSINDLESKDIITSVYDEGLAVSKNIITKKQNDSIYIQTVCGTTIDGLFQKNGIMSRPLCGGLVQIEDNEPLNFVEQIAYENTSITPLEAFSGKNNTSVLDVISSGDGIIPANFRMLPEAKKDEVLNILDQSNKIGIGGILSIGEPGKSVLGIDVPEHLFGLAIIGGFTPLCAALEEGYDLNIKLADNFVNYEDMTSINYHPTSKLFSTSSTPSKKVTYISNKIFNLIAGVDFNSNNYEGNIIANISYVNRSDLDESLDIMDYFYKNNPSYVVGNDYALIDDGEDKVGIATLCSLTINGILANKGIMSEPLYSGVLNMASNKRRFIELISYKGSSVDPHEIFINKNICDLSHEDMSLNKILASVHSIPYVARDDTLEIFDSLKNIGFDMLEIGKPNEYIYDAKIDMYQFGYVIPGGLNPIVNIKESGIPIDVKSIETLMDYETFEKL